MNLGIHSYYDTFNHDDRLFKAEAFSIGDGLERPFVTLRDLASSRGHRVGSCNRDNLMTFDCLVFLDYPSHSMEVLAQAKAAGIPCILVVLESEIIHAQNWDPRNYGSFRQVFTWNPVHNRAHGCFDLPLAQNLEFLPDSLPLRDRKFASLMAGNKKSKDPRELYSSRRKIIRWYEKNAPDTFDLYGFGWDQQEFLFSERVRKYCPPLAGMKTRPYTSYRGSVSQKRSVLSQYQFNICLENVRDIPGYVTEKIFDALAVGCIPVYQGDRNAADFVPADCWVDYSAFSGPGALHRRLAMMSWDEKEELQNRGRKFLASPEAQRFSRVHFAETLLHAAEETLG